jgi:hypothetical protein
MINLGVVVRVVALLAAALFLSSCGGSSDSTAADRPKSEPPLYHQANYDIEFFNGWNQVESDKPIGNVLETFWTEPPPYKSNVLVTSSTSEGSGPPRAEAELARDRMKQLPGYHERSFDEVELRGRPATQWTYEIGGIGRIEYYFEACGIHFAFAASSTVTPFGVPIELRYRRVAKTIKPICDS